jgi:hypothetical protein
LSHTTSSFSYYHQIRITPKVTVLPRITAANERATFPITFNPNKVNCLLSRRLTDSKAKDDMVVNEPQNPIAKRKEYFVSRFQNMDKIENTPRIKLPIIFIIRILTGSVPITIVDDTSLYLRNAPARTPTPNKTNSNPLIFNSPTKFYSIDRHYQHSNRSGSGYPKANAIA